VNTRRSECREEEKLAKQLSLYNKNDPSYSLNEYSPNDDEITKFNYTPEQIKKKTIANAHSRLIELSNWQTFVLWTMQWSCEDNITYECMRVDTADRIANGQDVIKYYGKWPFLRILGCQEIASTLFSILNFAPFFYYFFHLADQLPDTYWMKPIWYGYTISGMNTWVWSTAFHARDNIITERLDYFFATFSILFLLNIAIIRIFRLKSVYWPLTLIPSVVYFSWHCYTLHYIHFDYDWNMQMMVTFGASYCIVFFLWALLNPKASHRWKICLANALILIFASCEVFDFPPYFDIFDAHSIWHFATPICTVLTFKFAIDDAQYLHQVEMNKD
jgi:hypothetical protein